MKHVDIDASEPVNIVIERSPRTTSADELIRQVENGDDPSGSNGLDGHDNSSVRCSNVSKVLTVNTEYYQSKCSFFRNYDRTRLGKELERLTEQELDTIIHNEVLPIESKVLPFLRDKKIPNLDTEEGRRILSNLEENEMRDFSQNRLAIALCIEKFYREQNARFDGTQFDDPRTVEPCPCPPFPPTLQTPVFDPCKYPHILKLYAHFYSYCQYHRNLHNLAGTYYSRYNQTIQIPTIVLAALSSIASFIASSEVLSDYWKIRCTLSVGIISCIGAMMQSFSSAYQFNTKAEAHFNAAEAYDNIITEIDFEKSYPMTGDYFQQLEKKLLDVKKGCKYLIPTRIHTAYRESKARRRDIDFIHNKVIRPMKRDLYGAILSGDINEYRFHEQARHVQEYLERIYTLQQSLIETIQSTTTPLSHRKGSRCFQCLKGGVPSDDLVPTTTDTSD